VSSETSTSSIAAENVAEAPPGSAISDRGTARRLRRYRRFGWLQSAIGLAGVVAFFTLVNAQDHSAATLLRTGTRVPGFVTDYSGGSVDGPNGYIDVTYPAAGLARSGVIYLTPGSASYHVGEVVTVIYNPRNPSQIRTPQDANESNSSNGVGSLDILPFFGGILFMVVGWVVLRRARRWRRVLKQSPWVVYRVQYVRPDDISEFVLTPVEGSTGEPIPVSLGSTARWRRRRIARAAPASIWGASDPQGTFVIGLPPQPELFAAHTPRRSKRTKG
jgi:hypothetical protein